MLIDAWVGLAPDAAFGQAQIRQFGNGSVVPAVVVGPSSAFARWDAVAQQLRGQLQETPAPLAAAKRLGERYEGRSARELVMAIRRFVTSNIRYVPDGRVDAWADPAETAARGTGDCEDQAILGLYVALAAGVPADKAAVAMGFDRRGNQHAILLVVGRGGRLWMFDEADPRSPALSRSGFSPRLLGFLDAVGFPVTRLPRP
ncbi:transglutaminase-like cysteine proteinase BTLCP [Tistlia consotensis]|uniref:Transglutaminase-like cysteine proteinase BTLCP n=1 Tax=Tistlia consotensis USBA 355 TaxID=560819 RepID=A0A1Y6CCI5_9PROT|nr:transglutaminase family protein [Tistlia consotensis]SMF45772.1 transglutaminase-like cysteine proteinase BTLCP [Tistlia consotensis USBA 355]SNR79323.1 transglutaminase-like cysteine proteinase BTLCP [Tistlia consotensis]